MWVRREQDGTPSIGRTGMSQKHCRQRFPCARRPGARGPAEKPVGTIENARWAGLAPHCFVGVIRIANSAVLEDPSLLSWVAYDAWAARVEAVAGPDGALPDFRTWDGECRGYCDDAVGKGVHRERTQDRA
jgi:glycine cleavage system H lipoate-binding protein